MKHVKMFEAYDDSEAPRFFYGDQNETPKDELPMTRPGGMFGPGGTSQSYFDMLPKGLRNELTRPVKDMLADHTTKTDWAMLDGLMPKIEKLMAKSGLRWKEFPGIMRTSSIKYFGHFYEWLEKGYVTMLEDAYYSS